MQSGAKFGIILGLLGGLSGMVVAVIVAPVVGLIVSIPVVLLLIWLWNKILRPMFRREQLLKTGKRARGVIKEMWDTGWTVNEQPRIGLRLTIHPESGFPFDVKTAIVVSRLQTHGYQAGMELTVRYNPQKPDEVAIEAFGYGDAQPQVDVASLQAELEVRDRLNRQLNETGTEADAIVMESSDYGVPINDGIRYLTLKVKVLPAHGLPFEGELKSLFLPSSLHKYAPGKEIRVLYDSFNKSRIALKFGQ